MHSKDVIESSNPCDEIIDTPKNENILMHLINSYGGIASIVGSVYTGLNSFPLFRKSKVLLGIFKTFSFGMVGYDMFTKIKKYYTPVSSDNKKHMYISIILNYVEDEDIYVRSYNNRELPLSTEMLVWLLESNPSEMGGIEIKGYYNIDDGKTLTSINHKNASVLVSYNNNDYLLELSGTGSITFEDYELSASLSHITLKKIYCLSNVPYAQNLTDHIHAKYMESLGFDKNVITYNGYEIATRPRSATVDIEIDTIDFKVLKHDISQILHDGKRRGYIFVGPPGTGKTTILVKLENELTEFPIVYATAANINDAGSIDRLSKFIINLGRCIIFIEDMDALELASKTSKIAPLLTLLDNSRNHTSVVFVATINDASLITPSIARTGRFDEVLEIKAPYSDLSIYKVLYTSWKNIGGLVESFPLQREISQWTYYRLKSKKFTQSDYCEITQKIQLWGSVVCDKTIIKAMHEIVKAKKAFKKYKHHDSDD